MPSSPARIGFSILAVAVLAACAAMPPAAGSGGAITGPPPSANLDRVFLDRAAAGTGGEIALGELARQRGYAPGVRNFGAHLAFEHRRVHARLIALARRLHTAPSEERPDLRRLAMLAGPDFDRQFMADQITDQREALGLFESEAAAGRDPRLRRFVREWVPMLRRDLRQAERIAAQFVR